MSFSVILLTELLRHIGYRILSRASNDCHTDCRKPELRFASALHSVPEELYSVPGQNIEREPAASVPAELSAVRIPVLARAAATVDYKPADSAALLAAPAYSFAYWAEQVDRI